MPLMQVDPEMRLQQLRSVLHGPSLSSAHIEGMGVHKPKKQVFPRPMPGQQSPSTEQPAPMSPHVAAMDDDAEEEDKEDDSV